MRPPRPVHEYTRRPLVRSLRAKWALATAGAGLLPVLVLAALTVSIQRRGLEAAERELELAAIDQASSSVEGVFAAAEEAVAAAAAILADDRLRDEDAKLDLARRALARAEAVRGVAVFDALGAYVGAIARQEDAVFQRTMPEGARVATPRWIVEGGRATRHVAPLIADGATTGWLVADFDQDLLARRLEDVSRARFARPDRLVLVDGVRRSSGVDHPLVARARRGDALPATAMAMTSSYTSVSGEAMVGSLRGMPSRGLALVVERPEAEAFRTLSTTRRALMALAAAVALVAGGIGLLLGRRAARPIEQLSQLARAYGKRRFEAKSEVRTGDELESLGEDLERMAGALLGSEAEIARRAAVEAGLARYLPAELAAAVARGEADFALGGRRKRVTVLFADVAAFTSFAERTSPERVVGLLNELFAMLSEVVFTNGGMVDKFLGDCVMAVFGVGDTTRDHVADALRAASAMHRFVGSSAALFEAAYGFAPQLGIGVATGEALLGNLGSDTRMEFTVVGDTVNVASRLEGLALPKQTLVTPEVAAASPGGVELASLGTHVLRGKAAPVEIFEVVP